MSYKLVKWFYGAPMCDMYMYNKSDN